MTRSTGETLTFLFTDVDQSTDLVKKLAEGYAKVLEHHGRLLRAAFEENSGTEVDTQGDAFFAVFGSAREAVAAAADAQRALAEYPWPEAASVSVRMGLHSGESYFDEGRHTGVAVHRAARLCTAAHGGQVLLSRSTAAIVDDLALRGMSLRDLGDHELKDIERPEQIFQLVVEGLRSNFPPLRTTAEQTQLTGTATIVMVEGRRMMRRVREMEPRDFGALLTEYRGLLEAVFADCGGHESEFSSDTAVAAFPTAKAAALAAVAAQRAVVAHAWPFGLEIEVSVGLHSGQAGIGWLGPTAWLCVDLCDAADAGEIFMSQATASLLEEETLGDLEVRDVGEPKMRHTGEPIRAFELVYKA